MNGNSTQIWSERWRLAALTKKELIETGLAAVMIGMIFVLFHLQGNTTDITAFGRSAIIWMVTRWNESGGDFSHGWIIPFVSMGLIWYKRQELLSAAKKLSRAGLWVIVAALFMHWLGAKAQQTRISLLALILLMWGIPFYFYGWEVAKILSFPFAFLVFCIPLNFLDSITFPLRMWVTLISTALLKGLGVAAERSGSAILSPSFNLDVADPCSGLRSLLAMTALTAFYAYVTQRTLIRKWILFLASIPLAIAGNIARVTTIALVAEAFGQQAAAGIYHDYSSYIFFPVAIGLMVAVGSFLNRDFTRMWQRWKQKLLLPT